MYRGTLRLGPVFVDREDGHTHCLDLVGETPRFFVDSEKEFVPLSLYLREHPERRAGVVSVIRERLGA